MNDNNPPTVKKFHEMVALNNQFLSTQSKEGAAERKRGYRMSLPKTSFWKRNDPVWRSPDTQPKHHESNILQPKMKLGLNKALVRKDVAIS